MKPQKKWSFTLLTLIGFLILLFLLNISLGSVYIPFDDILRFLTGQMEASSSQYIILDKFRLPKSITALLVGGALGLSGLHMQTLFRNPLAGPYVLGISSGAGLGIALTIFLGTYIQGFFDLSLIGRSWLYVSASAIGSLLVLMVIILVSIRVRDSTSLLIVGLMFGAATSAIVSVLQFFSQAENIQAYVIWSFGSLGSLSWYELYIFVPVIVLGMLLTFFLSKNLNALLLGESYAMSSGLNLKTSRYLIIFVTAILAGTVTAFCGPIAFFGIAIPHIARMLFNTTNHLILTPLIILVGGILMLIFDSIAQIPGYEATLPINAVTSIFGAPFVIYLLLRKRSINFS
jgi:iron complex transport system permease protein